MWGIFKDTGMGRKKAKKTSEDSTEEMSSLGNVGATELEGESACKTLPDELVEKIIAMVPFPAIFKARCLSKSWRARLSCISVVDDDASKCLATAFQRQVVERSSNWDTYWSVFQFQTQVVERPSKWDRHGSVFSSCQQTGSQVVTGRIEFFGYNLASHIWRRMPALSFLPKWDQAMCMQMEGAILCAFGPLHTPGTCDLYVANILTRSWKRLSKPPHSLDLKSLHLLKLVIDASEVAYKVILLCEKPVELGCIYSQIYDSMSNAWSSFEIDDVSGCLTRAAYLNGLLYVIALRPRPVELLAYNLEERTSVQRLPLWLDFTGSDPWSCTDIVNLVVYKGDLLMTITKLWCEETHPSFYPDRFDVDVNDTSLDEETQLVFRIDLQTGTALQLARGPPGDLKMREVLTKSIIVGNCIIFGREEDPSNRRCQRVLQYNLDTDEWSHFETPGELNWNDCSFQPGVNPFFTV